jgi:hypothetical protein
MKKTVLIKKKMKVAITVGEETLTCRVLGSYLLLGMSMDFRDR